MDLEVLPCPVAIQFSSSLPAEEFWDLEEPSHLITIQALAHRVEMELSMAKSKLLMCGEIILPDHLLIRIATDVLRMAEKEPCGLRGCALYLSYEDEHFFRRIGKIRCDPRIVATFEVFLTLKRDTRAWFTRLPQFFRNLTRGGTVVISPGFTLLKKKLYRSYQQ